MFTPSAGLWSREEFDDPTGATIPNPTLQNITGGLVTLIPQIDESLSYVTTWPVVSGWMLQNSLASQTIIDSQFTVVTGTTSGSQVSTIIPITQGGAIQFTTPALISGAGSSWVYFQANSSEDSKMILTGLKNNYPITFEIEVQSLIQVHPEPLPGYSGGQITLSGISPLTGTLNHGIYIETPTRWDFLEFNPAGIRSLNHPEVAIPVDLSSPKRVRIGLHDNNLYLLTENGRGVASIGNFGNPGTGSNRPPYFVIGAPDINQVYTYSFTGINGFVGESVWRGLRVITGQLLAGLPSGLLDLYSTGTQTLYTDYFDPIIPIAGYLSASVEFIPHEGGDTIVTTQYSGQAGWTDLVSITLTGDSPNHMSLLGYVPSNQGFGAFTGTQNKIRFKIQQDSRDGSSPSSAVSAIEILARQLDAFLDLQPDWKPITHPIVASYNILADRWRVDDPFLGPNTKVLFNCPPDLSELDPNFSINGTGVVTYDSRFGAAFQNFVVQEFTPTSGTALAQVFGNGPIDNLYPDPYFDNNFRPISGVARFVSGCAQGVIGSRVEFPGNYTGHGYIISEEAEIVRPTRLARANWESRILNNIGHYPQNSAQQITIKGSIVSPDVGIELVVPSHVSSSKILVQGDLQIITGDRLFIYSTGSAVYTGVNLAGADYRDFAPFSYIAGGNITGEMRLGFRAPTGSSSDIKFVLDNILVAPIQDGYIGIQSITGTNFTFGQSTNITGQPIVPRSATVFNTDLYLSNYPTGQGVLFKYIAGIYTGLQISISTDGYPVADFDLLTRAWTTGAGNSGAETYLRHEYLTGEAKVPLGRWSNIGFIHQQESYPGYAGTAYSGQTGLSCLVASNRALITLDGEVIGSKDLQPLWNGRCNIGDLGPLPTYLATGVGTGIMMTGLLGRLDGLLFSRPPIADAELQLSVRGARNSGPYLMPEVLLGPGTTGDNVLGGALYAGSIYNLAGPGLTNWDHGELKNHLIFTGVITSEDDTPYQGVSQNLNCTRFSGFSYGYAKYSSTTDRLINPTGAIAIQGLSNIANAGPIFGCWVKLDTKQTFSASGDLSIRGEIPFFEIVYDSNSGSQNALVLGYDVNGFFLERRTTGNNFTWQVSANSQPISDTWYHIAGQVYYTGIWKAAGDASWVASNLYINGSFVGGFTGTGVDYAFQYMGRSGHTVSSQINIGQIRNTGSILMADAFLIFPTGIKDPSFYNNIASTTGDKHSQYNVLFRDSDPYTGLYKNLTYSGGYVNIPNGDSPAEYLFWMMSNGGYGTEAPSVEGFPLYNENIFREVAGYYIQYNDSSLLQRIGDVISPIKIGDEVPPGAVNLARIDSPSFTTENSIATVDLSDSNPGNLASYRGGIYTVNISTTGASQIVTGFHNINGAEYTGRADVDFIGQVATKDVLVTSLSSETTADELFYCYLLGRGNYGVSIIGAEPHYTGLSMNSTGQVVDNYLFNKNLVKNNITLKTTNGTVVNDFTWEILTSPYSTQDLATAIASGEDLSAQGFSTGILTGLLPDGIFSVLLLSTEKVLPSGQTLWAHFPAYNFISQTEDRQHREVVNAIPLMRERLPGDSPEAGQFEAILNTSGQKNFDLVVYGIPNRYGGLT